MNKKGYWIDEATGNIRRTEPAGHKATRYFSEKDWREANNYSKIVKNRNQKTSNSSSSSKSSKGEGSGCGTVLVVIVALIFAAVSSVKSCYNNAIGNHGGYITTLQNFSEYSKIEDKPLGKEIGKIPADNVLYVKKVSNKGELTWIQVLKLVNNEPKMTYICLPEKKVSIEKENKFVLYNEKSRTWDRYYQRIDELNKPIYNKYKKQFQEEIKKIEIKKGKDSITKESVKDSSFFLDADGYFDLYKTTGSDFYYIDKNQKSDFLSSYKNNIKKYEQEKKKYF